MTVAAILAIGVLDKALGGKSDQPGNIAGVVEEVVDQVDDQAAVSLPGPGPTVEPSSVEPAPTSENLPVSIAPAPTSAAPSYPTGGATLATDVLAFIRVEREHDGGYERDLFQYGIDADEDGCNTRDEVLQEESLTSIDTGFDSCAIAGGRWLSLYDLQETTEPTELEIDHVVALKEAWDSGAWAWGEELRIAFANDLTDPRTLRAVTSSSKSAKGESDPSQWKPDEPSVLCEYLGDWVSIKGRWGLSMDESEYGFIAKRLRTDCRGLTVEGWTDIPVIPTFAAVTIPPETPTADLYFPNCDAARASGAAPLYVGEPGYRPKLDGDKDGVACE